MKCERCDSRPATRIYEVPRHRGIVDIYRLCMCCHSEATGIPLARAPVCSAPPCVSCGGPGGVSAGLCASCAAACRAAVNYHHRGGTVGLEGMGAQAALRVVLEEARRWRTYPKLKALRENLMNRGVAAK